MSGIMSMLLGAVSSAAAAADEFFNRVTLLLNTSSTNGAQNNTFLDSSSNNFTITRNGNTTQGTFTPFSQTGWSNYFDGSSYLNVGTSGQSDFNFPAPSGSTNNFCIELWFYATGTLSATTYTALVGCHDGVDSSSWSTFVRSNGVFIYGSTNTFTGGGTVNSNTWNHAVFVRSADNVSVYLNGSRVDTQTRSGAYNNTSDLLHIGDDNSGTNPPFTGYISNVRILKGSSAAIYSGTSITVPTIPLTAVTGTVLLSSQSNRFVDNSSVASSITVGAGTPSVQAFSPFAPTAAYSTSVVGGSGYFDGSGDYLTVADNANLRPPNGDFTYEIWWYPTSLSGIQGIFTKGNGVQIYLASGVMNCSLSSNNTTTYFINSSFGATAPILNAWNHIAVVRSGNSYYGYLNGNRTLLGTSASFPGTGTNAVGIGAYDSAIYFTSGYLSGARYTTGALYTASPETVPTSPPTTTVSAGTCQLLTNFTNAGIIDNTAKNDLETVGNAQVSTTQAKFGTTSMSFDGTGDYLLIPSSQTFELKAENFTIELFINVNAAPSANTQYKIFYPVNHVSGQNRLVFYINQNIIRVGYFGTDIAASSALTWTTGQWYHVAVVRNGSTWTIYRDGTSVATGTNSITLGTDTGYIIGENLNAYFDEYRISKLARYTANFTAPTAAFPIQ